MIHKNNILTFQKLIFSCLFFGLFNQCQKSQPSIDGKWRATIPTVIGSIPFNLEIETLNDTIHVYAINGEEKLELDNAFFEDDSLHITMELFDAEIIAKVNGPEMNGIYQKKLGDLSNREGEFSASQNEDYRFSKYAENALHNVSGKWKTTFTEPEGDTYDALGVFSQKGNEVTRTFLTTTGDYRYLAGNVVGDSLFLSALMELIFIFSSL